MSSSRTRRIASLLNADNTKVKSALVSSVTASSVTVYSSPTALPVTGNSVGDQGFVTSNNNLYIWNGNGWYVLVNVSRSPFWITQPSSAYSYQDTGANFKILAYAGDSDENPLVYTFTTDSDFDNIATITKDSDGADGAIFTVQFDSENIDSEDSGTGNVIFSVSDGTTTINAPSDFTLSFFPIMMGANYGYTTGGFGPQGPGQPNAYLNIIDRFSYAANTTGSDVGDLNSNRGVFAVGQSSTKGYVAGGRTAPPGSSQTNQITSFTFGSSATGVDTTHDLDSAWANAATQSYGVGDGNSTYFFYGTKAYEYDFASNVAEAGTVAPAPSYEWGGHSSSPTNGYMAGYHLNGITAVNSIQRFPFTSNTTVVDVGDLGSAKYNSAGNNSLTHGYASGGKVNGSFPQHPQNLQKTIMSWPFASDTNSTTTGSLIGDTGTYPGSTGTEYQKDNAGSSSRSYGHSAGGDAIRNMIQRWPFASNSNGPDFGDLSYSRMELGGYSN